MVKIRVMPKVIALAIVLVSLCLVSSQQLGYQQGVPCLPEQQQLVLCQPQMTVEVNGTLKPFQPGIGPYQTGPGYLQPNQQSSVNKYNPKTVTYCHTGYNNPSGQSCYPAQGSSAVTPQAATQDLQEGVPRRPQPKIEVYGFEGCGWFTKAVNLARSIVGSANVKVVESLRCNWEDTLSKLSCRMTKPYRSSPIVFINGEFVGGYSELENYKKANPTPTPSYGYAC